MHINKTKQNKGKKQFHYLTCQVAANINMLMFLDTFIRVYAHSHIYLQNTYEKYYFSIFLFHHAVFHQTAGLLVVPFKFYKSRSLCQHIAQDTEQERLVEAKMFPLSMSHT